MGIESNMPVKLLACLVQEYLSWNHMHSEPPCGLMVLTHVDEDDLKLACVRVTQILHHRLHLLAGDTAHGAKLQHNELAVLFCLSKHAVNVARLAAARQKQDAYEYRQGCSQ